MTRNHLGPVGCWFTRDLIANHVRFHGSSRIVGAVVHDGRVDLRIEQDGRPARLEADHVIAATGYRVDIDRLTFLDPALRATIATAQGTPILSRSFESSTPGLFFVGVTAANMFGPLLRFACGADFASKRLAGHLAPRRSRGQVQRSVSPASRPTPADTPY